MLRTLAGIYEPVRGDVAVEGTIGALLDANLGMSGDLTGRENIALRGLYSGLRRTEIRALENDVQEFADLGEFLDLPVRFYSAGMVVRLGFGLATAIRPQVLLMDEWLLAGDAAFMQRAEERLEGHGARRGDLGALVAHAEDRRELVHAGALDGPGPDPHGRYAGRGAGRLRGFTGRLMAGRWRRRLRHR